MSSRWVFLVPVVLIALLASASPGRLQAQGPSGWSTPVNLSESDTASYYPDVAVDSAGHVYVVWGEFSREGMEGWPDMLMLRVWDGQTWSPANDIAVGGHLPQIEVDSRGRLHLVWIGDGVRYSRAWAQDDPTDARSWEPSRNLGFGYSYYPHMVVDRQDRVHVAFVGSLQNVEERVADENGLCAVGCYGAFYVRSIDGGDTWSTPIQLDAPEIDSGTPRLAFDGRDGIYAVWVEANMESNPLAIGVSFSMSRDGGETWTPPTTIASDETGYEWPAVAVDSRGTIHVVWRYRGSGRLGYVSSADGGISWTPVEKLPFLAGGAYSHGLVVDSADNLHLVIPLPLNVSHVVRSPQGEWSAPIPVSLNPCNVAASYVGLQIAKGNQLHAVWYDRQECELGWLAPSGRGEVFYSTLTTDAPALPLATLPPMPTSTPAPTPTQQPTPSPMLSPAAPTWQPLVGQEQQAAPTLPPLTVGIGLAVALVVVVIAGWSLRHRR